MMVIISKQIEVIDIQPIFRRNDQLRKNLPQD